MKAIIILAAVLSVCALLADGAVVPLERHNSPVIAEEPSKDNEEPVIQEVDFSDPNFDPAVAKKPAAAGPAPVAKGPKGQTAEQKVTKGQTEGQKVMKGRTEPLKVKKEPAAKKKNPSASKFTDEEVAEIMSMLADELVAMDPAVRVRIRVRRPGLPMWPPYFPPYNPMFMASGSASAALGQPGFAVADELEDYNDEDYFY